MYINPATGERRTPPRADQPMPEIYARQGFERVEIMNMGKFERDFGVVHEASNFSAGNESLAFKEPELPKAPKEVLDALAKDVADAAASGPWTESENSPSSFLASVPLAK